MLVFLNQCFLKSPQGQTDKRQSKDAYTGYAGWAVTAGIPVNSAPRMADQDLKLAVRNALRSMGAEGFPGSALFSGILSKI